MSDWFKLSSNVVDRDDLSIYEKMCCVVLARYAQEADLSLDQLALKMGVEEIIAKGAFYSLMKRGILELEDQSQKIKPGTIIKAHTEVVKVAEASIKSTALLSNDEKVQRVCAIIDEKLSEREAKIILSFAENDIDKIIEKYKIAKSSQYRDKVEILINELQKKENSTSNIVKNHEIKEGAYEGSENNSDDRPPIQKTQLNTYKINLMKKYKGK